MSILQFLPSLLQGRHFYAPLFAHDVPGELFVVLYARNPVQGVLQEA